MSSNEQRHERFEDWFLREFSTTASAKDLREMLVRQIMDRSKYGSVETQIAWEAWQAAEARAEAEYREDAMLWRSMREAAAVSHIAPIEMAAVLRAVHGKTDDERANDEQ